MAARTLGGADCYPQVAARVRDTIAQSSDQAASREILGRLMARPGRMLAPEGRAKWPAFVLDTCQALGGDPGEAIGAAAAVEFVAAVADIVDDLVDDEWDEAVIPWGRALNTGVALPWLAQRCVDDSAGRLGAERARHIGALVARGYLAACAGEDLDLLLEDTPVVSEELAHEMTQRKAGSLVAMACQVGAAIVTDQPDVLDAVGRFGGHVGVVAQLLNDLAGVDPGTPARGSDIRRRKKTLPIAYALRCAREEALTPALAVAEATEDEERIARAVRDLGGLHYTWVVADTHRREALAVVETLVQLTGREAVRGLRRLVPAVRSRRSWRGGA